MYLTRLGHGLAADAGQAARDHVPVFGILVAMTASASAIGVMQLALADMQKRPPETAAAEDEHEQ